MFSNLIEDVVPASECVFVCTVCWHMHTFYAFLFLKALCVLKSAIQIKSLLVIKITLTLMF